jgi:hypothetical protein
MANVQEGRRLAEQIRQDALSLAGTLRGRRTEFDGFIQSITGDFAETATSADKDAVQNIKKARSSVDDAVRALENAAKSAGDWAKRL